MMRHPTPEPKQTTHRPQSREAPPDDAELYERGTATLLSSWEEYARATRDSAVRRLPGVAIAIFRQAPERGIYNAALLERGLSARGRAEAIAAMEGAYREAGVTRFAAWVHERDVPMYRDLMDRAYRVDEITPAMGMELSDIRVPESHLNFEHAEWSEHLRVAERPPLLLTSIGSDAFQILVGSLGCESVSTGVAFDLVPSHPWHRLDAAPALDGVEMSLVGELGRERSLTEALDPRLGEYDAWSSTRRRTSGCSPSHALVVAELVSARVSAEDDGSLHGIREPRQTLTKLTEQLSGPSPTLMPILTRWQPLRIGSRPIERHW